jgi:hypothetical protein
MIKSSDRTALCVTVLLVLLAGQTPAPAAQDAAVGILPFKTQVAGKDTVMALHSSLVSAARRGALFETPRRDASSLWYSYEQGAAIPDASLKRYGEICGLLQCGRLLMGRIYSGADGPVIEARLFSLEGNKFLCTIETPLARGGIKNSADMLARKVSLFLAGKLPVMSNLAASKGTSMEKVSLSWKCNTPGAVFTVTRSYYEKGPYAKIGETESTRFVDTTAEEGFKCWYAVSPAAGEVQGISAAAWGYRRPPGPKSLTMDEIMSGHDRPWPAQATAEGKEREKLHLQLYEKYYESYFTMTFIIMVGRIYINNGELLAYRDFTSYTWDPANRIIFLHKRGMAPVKFFSKRFFRFVRDMYQLKIPFDELLPRAITNAMLFCVRANDREQREPGGRTRFVAVLEAAGMATEYHHDYENWKGNTIVFSTSDDDLYRKIREAQTKGY